MSWALAILIGFVWWLYDELRHGADIERDALFREQKEQRRRDALARLGQLRPPR